MMNLIFSRFFKQFNSKAKQIHNVFLTVYYSCYTVTTRTTTDDDKTEKMTEKIVVVHNEELALEDIVELCH